MKKQPGDVLYYWERKESDIVQERKCRLAIEVKHVNKQARLSFTRSEYNLWISEHRKSHEDHRRDPHLFVAICRQGVILMPWEDFRTTYLAYSYPQDAPAEIPPTKIDAEGKETKIRNANSFDPRQLTWGDPSANGLFEHDSDRATKNETEFVAALNKACKSIWNDNE